MAASLFPSGSSALMGDLRPGDLLVPVGSGLECSPKAERRFSDPGAVPGAWCPVHRREAAGGQVLPGCSSQGRRICSKPWQGLASQLMWALQRPSPSPCAPKTALLRAPINLLRILGASCKKILEACLAFADNASVSPGEPCSPAQGQRMCWECGWECGWGSREGQQQQDCQPPACTQAEGRERGLSLGWGFHWPPSSAALSHPTASARRGKQGCSDTQQGFVRSREPGLGRNPKMRFAVEPRSGKQGWWRTRRCHPPAPAPGRGDWSVTRGHGGPVP